MKDFIQEYFLRVSVANQQFDMIILRSMLFSIKTKQSTPDIWT